MLLRYVFCEMCHKSGELSRTHINSGGCIYRLRKAVELKLSLLPLFQESESNTELKHKMRHLERQLESKQNRYHKGIKTAII